MRHILYAMFERETDLREAHDAIVASGVAPDECNEIRRAKDLRPELIDHAESAALSGLARGAALGGVLGALAGGLLLGAEGAPVAVAGASAIFGGFAGALGGAGQPEPLLERLTQQVAAGNVLLVVATPDLDTQTHVEALVRNNHGVVEGLGMPRSHQA